MNTIYAMGYTQSRAVTQPPVTTIRRFPVAVSVDPFAYQGGDVTDHDGNTLKENSILAWAFTEQMVEDWLANNPPLRQDVGDMDIEG